MSTDIKDIIRRIVTSSRLEYCAICGKCLAFCPTYRETSLELHSPRGRLVLVKGLIDGELSPAGPKLYESLDWCLLCGACNTACPAGIRPADAIMFARCLEEYRGRQSGVEKLILKNVMKEQGLLGMVSLPMRFAQLTGLTALVQARLVRRLLPSRLRIMPEMMPPRWERKLAGSKGTDSIVRHHPDGLKVTYFVGCAMNVILPGIARDTIRLLEAAGCAVRFPDEYFCCGAPHIHEGDLTSTLDLAQKNILLLGKDESEIITSDCDSCTATIKGYEDVVSEPSLKEAAAGISRRCLALTELLERLNITDLEYTDFGNTRVAWDDPCELQHAQGITNPPRNILKNLPGVTLIELPESDWCCGCAGSYVIKHPDMSNRVLERKIDSLREIDIDVVLTSNPGCYLQLNRGIRDAGLDIQVEHISSFLCRHLKNSAETPF